ncbi:FBW10 protein, partial [Polypterus senegalus]|nr:FBW10 protein [Polypterus senegalus]
MKDILVDDNYHLVDSEEQPRCPDGFCGTCEKCLLKQKLSATSEWFLRASDVSKRKFLTGIIWRCQPRKLLEKTSEVLQVTLGKDFTYSRSRINPGLPGDRGTFGSDRALDPNVLRKEILQTWDWFGQSTPWTKCNYILGLLLQCEVQLLHVIGNLVRLLLARERFAERRLKSATCVEDLEDESSTIPESFKSSEHPELELLIQACPTYGRIPANTFPEGLGVRESQTSRETWVEGRDDEGLSVADLCLSDEHPEPDLQIETCPRTEAMPADDTAEEQSCQPPKGQSETSNARETTSFRAATEQENGRIPVNGSLAQQYTFLGDSSDSVSSLSDEPAILVVPTSFQSRSGVSRYRDFIRCLPVHLAKCILGVEGRDDEGLSVADLCLSDEHPEPDLQIETCPRAEAMPADDTAEEQSCQPPKGQSETSNARETSYLNKQSLSRCLHVSRHWRWLTEEVMKELLVRRMVQNQVMILQGTSPKGVSPVYAKMCQITVPQTGPDGELIPLSTEEFALQPKGAGVQGAYNGLKTELIDAEERNVYCGSYNVLMLKDHDDASRIIDFSCGKLVAFGSKERQVRFLDITSAKEVPPLIRGHAGSIRALLLCEQRGLVFSGSYDLSIRCWSLATGSCLKIFRGHMGTIHCLDLCGNRLVSGAKDCRVKIWNLETGKSNRKMKFKHQDPIRCVKMDETHVVSACKRGQIKVWHLETATLVKVMDGHRGAVTCLHFDKWHILSGGEDGYIMSWSTHPKYKKSLMTFRHPKEVLCLAFQYLRVISGCEDGKIRVFNFLTGECLRVIRANSRSSPVLSFIADENRLMINTKANILLFQFAPVAWDYTLKSVREVDSTWFLEEDWQKTVFLKKHPYPYVRAQRMRRVGTANRKIYQQEPEEHDGEGKCLSHHARSLSATSMRRAQTAQKESMKPATWSEMQGYRRSMAYIDLQPEFFVEPPSALKPGRPVRSGSSDTPSRQKSPDSEILPRTPVDKAPPTRSERLVMQRIKNRGPHHPPTTENILLTINAIHLSQKAEELSANMEINTQVRDAWGPTPVLDSATSTPQKVTCASASVSAKFPGFCWEVTKSQSQLVTRDVEVNLKKSPLSQQVKLNAPKSAMTQFKTSSGTGDLGDSSLRKERPWTASAIGVQKVGNFSTTAQHTATLTPQVMTMTTGSVRRQAKVKPESASGERSKQLDPYRVASGFQLCTFRQNKEHEQNQLRQYEDAQKKAREDRTRESRKAWLTKLRGLPRDDFTREGKVAAPELGHGVYL